MTPDPIDQLGARLFQAAREEPLPQGAAQRAIIAAQRELTSDAKRARRLPWRTASAIGLAAAALAAGVALRAQREEPASRISAEPASSARPARVEQPADSAVSAKVADPVPAVAKAPPSAVVPSPARSAPASLTDELNSLKLASNALSAGDTQAALAALDQYDHVLKGQKMRAEATLLRIEALSRAGRGDAASALAAQFVAQNPESPLVDRARSFVQK